MWLLPLAVLDSSGNGAIPNAVVSLNLPDLSSERTDSGGKYTFVLTKDLIGKSATLTVNKEGFKPYDEHILSLQALEEFHRVYLIPPPPSPPASAAPQGPPEFTRVYSSGQKSSGSGGNFSDWYTVCSTEEPVTISRIPNSS